MVAELKHADLWSEHSRVGLGLGFRVWTGTCQVYNIRHFCCGYHTCHMPQSSLHWISLELFDTILAWIVAAKRLLVLVVGPCTVAARCKPLREGVQCKSSCGDVASSCQITLNSCEAVPPVTQQCLSMDRTCERSTRAPLAPVSFHTPGSTSLLSTVAPYPSAHLRCGGQVLHGYVCDVRQRKQAAAAQGAWQPMLLFFLCASCW